MSFSDLSSATNSYNFSIDEKPVCAEFTTTPGDFARFIKEHGNKEDVNRLTINFVPDNDEIFSDYNIGQILSALDQTNPRTTEIIIKNFYLSPSMSARLIEELSLIDDINNLRVVWLIKPNTDLMSQDIKTVIEACESIRTIVQDDVKSTHYFSGSLSLDVENFLNNVYFQQVPENMIDTFYDALQKHEINAISLFDQETTGRFITTDADFNKFIARQDYQGNITQLTISILNTSWQFSGNQNKLLAEISPFIKTLIIENYYHNEKLAVDIYKYFRNEFPGINIQWSLQINQLDYTLIKDIAECSKRINAINEVYLEAVHCIDTPPAVNADLQMHFDKVGIIPIIGNSEMSVQKGTPISTSSSDLSPDTGAIQTDDIKAVSPLKQQQSSASMVQQIPPVNLPPALASVKSSSPLTSMFAQTTAANSSTSLSSSTSANSNKATKRKSMENDSKSDDLPKGGNYPKIFRLKVLKLMKEEAERERLEKAATVQGPKQVNSSTR
jgi:hypothetical protein